MTLFILGLPFFFLKIVFLDGVTDIFKTVFAPHSRHGDKILGFTLGYFLFGVGNGLSDSDSSENKWFTSNVGRVPSFLTAALAVKKYLICFSYVCSATILGDRGYHFKGQHLP